MEVKKRRSFESRITRLSLLGSLPLFALLLGVLIYSGFSIWLTLLILLIFSLLIAYVSIEIHRKTEAQFRRLHNILDSMTVGDYTLRARSDQSPGALDDLVHAINRLADRLSQQRTESVESRLLLDTVIKSIDVAIIALNQHNSISFMNQAAEKLLQASGLEPSQLLNERLDLSRAHNNDQIISLNLGRQPSKFSVHIEEFRESGLQHKLLFLTDISTLLRAEELKAWQRLVRVLSHEINNSLAPIISISETLLRQAKRNAMQHNNTTQQNKADEGNKPEEPNNPVEHNKEQADNQELTCYLKIIANRADGLKRFIESYKQLAKLPEPQKEWVPIAKLIQKIQTLFKGQPLNIYSTEALELYIDPLQFEQVLINLFTNAAESMAHREQKGKISVEWGKQPGGAYIKVNDEGKGISNPANLFVPFYTTKKNGSGIGLLLCRQVIEAHGGHLSLSNREGAQGCCVTIELFYS